MKLPIIIGVFFLGVVMTVFVYQAITIYQLRSIVANDHAVLSQVVAFLQQSKEEKK